MVLCAFDLLELDGHDLRRAPIEERKATLAKLLRRPVDGIAFNEYYSGDGATFTRMPARSAVRGSYQSASVRRIGPVAPSVG